MNGIEFACCKALMHFCLDTLAAFWKQTRRKAKLAQLKHVFKLAKCWYLLWSKFLNLLDPAGPFFLALSKWFWFFTIYDLHFHQLLFQRGFDAYSVINNEKLSGSLIPQAIEVLEKFLAIKQPTLLIASFSHFTNVLLYCAGLVCGTASLGENRLK